MISEDETRKIAQLSRLYLTDEEVAKFARDLSEILGYAEKLLALDVDRIEGLSHVQSVSNVLRPDVVGTHLSVDEGLSNAPQHEGRFFVVPLVVE